MPTEEPPPRFVDGFHLPAIRGAAGALFGEARYLMMRQASPLLAMMKERVVTDQMPEQRVSGPGGETTLPPAGLHISLEYRRDDVLDGKFAKLWANASSSTHQFWSRGRRRWRANSRKRSPN